MPGIPAAWQKPQDNMLVVPHGPTCTATLKRKLSVMGRENAGRAVGQAEHFKNGNCHSFCEKI